MTIPDGIGFASWYHDDPSDFVGVERCTFGTATEWRGRTPDWRGNWYSDRSMAAAELADHQVKS